jgi:hypothetical protein
MKPAICIFFLLLAACAHAQGGSDCAGLRDTAIGAALQDPKDTYNLGVAFYKGKCVGKDYSKAAQLWDRASKAGVVSAKNNLGYLYSEGLGVKKDQARAVTLWLEAARQNHAEAQVHLGNAYFYGYGVPQDRVRGLAWIFQAETSARIAPEVGGGVDVGEMATDQERKMLRVAPGLRKQAQALVGHLGVGH